MTAPRRLYFVTTNANKVRSPKAILEPFGIEVVQLSLDIPELQAETAQEVAAAKARWAFERVNQPLFVADTALHIPILNGFPGTNVKWVTRDIGLDGYLRLLAPWSDWKSRSCYFEDAIACVVGSEEALFSRRIWGRVAGSVRGEEKPDQTSSFWRLFIPDGFGKTLAEMSPEELAAFRMGIRGPYEDLAAWFLSRK